MSDELRDKPPSRPDGEDDSRWPVAGSKLGDQYFAVQATCSAWIKKIDQLVRPGRWDRSLLKHAERGDTPEAARWLVARLAEHLSEGTPLPHDVLEKLVGALREISEGEDANRALWLKPSRGKRSLRLDEENPRIRDPLLVLEVQRLVREGMQLSRNEATEGVQSAFDIVAECNGMTYGVVMKVYYAHHRR